MHLDPGGEGDGEGEGGGGDGVPPPPPQALGASENRKSNIYELTLMIIKKDDLLGRHQFPLFML